MTSMKVHRAIRCYDGDRTVCNTANTAWVTDDPEQVTCGRCAQTSENTVKFEQICASMCDLVRAEFEWSHGSPSDARARMGYILDEVRGSH